MSALRKVYMARLIGRIVVLVATVALWFVYPQCFDIIHGMNFFKSFSPFHLLWGVWVFDMFLQLIPTRSKLALGSQKLFVFRFRPVREKINKQTLKNHIQAATKAAYKVMILWVLLLGAVAALYYTGVIGKTVLFLFSVAFYVCDLICVLIWCPFRLIMKTKCCTTCRIFNWDHFMMFSPLVFMGGFFGLSLAGLSIVCFLYWELSVLMYPERFVEVTNASLQCCECTDKLCTQYCKKLRK